MSASNGLGTYGDGVGVVTPTDHKLAHLGLVSKTGAGTNTIRPGLFYDGVSSIVTGTANMSYNVAAFTAVSSRSASAGGVLFVNDGTVNVVTDAAPGTNSRIDVVYAWQKEFSLDGGTTEPIIDVEIGTAAASPTVPSLSAYPGAIELARITVPAGVTATNSGTTITQTAPFTSVDGGQVFVRTSAALPASGVLDARAYDLATNDSYRWNGSAWEVRARGIYRWADSTARSAQTGMRSGDFGFQVDTAAYYRYTGSAWRIWEQAQTTYTPTFGNTTLGNGTRAGYYSVTGGRVSVSAIFTLGSTSAVSGDINVSVPYTRDTTIHPNGDAIAGTLHFVDSSASTRLFGTFVAITNNTACRIVSGTTLAVSATTSSTPFTWATGDQVIANFEYYTSQ